MRYYSGIEEDPRHCIAIVMGWSDKLRQCKAGRTHGLFCGYHKSGRWATPCDTKETEYSLTEEQKVKVRRLIEVVLRAPSYVRPWCEDMTHPGHAACVEWKRLKEELGV